MEWSIHLQAYFESNVSPKEFGYFLLLLNMLSRSETAREHSWFKRSLSLLQGFFQETFWNLLFQEVFALFLCKKLD
jgi:hypothetical protein